MTKGLLSQLPSPPTGKTGWPWTEETAPATYDNKTTWPTVSIVTPSYNQGQFIEETIRSILLQNYPNIEYLIIDGGSTDETISIIKKYESWITSWISEKDSGQSNAINKGIEKISGEIFNWINSDDILLKDALKNILPHFADPEIGCVAGRCSFIDQKQKKTTPLHLLDGRDYRILCGTANTYQPASFFRLNLLKKNLGKLSEDLHYGMDIELYTIIGLVSTIYWIDEIVCAAKLHANAKTIASISKFSDDCASVFSKTLRSVDNAANVIVEMKKLNLYTDGVDTYPNNKELSAAAIMMSFRYFLLTQLFFLTSGNNKAAAEKIFSYLKKEHYSFYKEKKLSSSHWLNKKYLAHVKIVYQFIKSQ